jgi:uncharacterized protein (DUF2062 family)/SAM-dependent methyltransferase
VTLWTRARKSFSSIGPRIRGLLHEQLEPGRAAAAVLVGITVGIVPIYGLQSVTAIALATVFRLNRALTLAATFINNPLMQPLFLAGSLQLGHRLTDGAWVSLSLDALRKTGVGTHLWAIAVGSVVISLVVGLPAAAVTYVVVAGRARRSADLSAWRAFVAGRYAGVRGRDRGFVRWKTRLDNVFELLLGSELGSGPVVDLGCGHGIALALAAFRDPSRPLRGCDLDAASVRAAGLALAGLDASVRVADIREYPVPDAGLILIIDVLQYLEPADQVAVLERCAASLRPGGILIIRVPDTAGGWRSRLTKALDVIALRSRGSSVRLRYQGAATFTGPLERAGLSVSMRAYRNTLPLTHVLIQARRAGGTA